jgi:hypothetical protein
MVTIPALSPVAIILPNVATGCQQKHVNVLDFSIDVVM